MRAARALIRWLQPELPAERGEALNRPAAGANEMEAVAAAFVAMFRPAPLIAGSDPDPADVPVLGSLTGTRGSTTGKLTGGRQTPGSPGVSSDPMDAASL